MFTAKLKTLAPTLLIVALCAVAAHAQQTQPPTPSPSDNYVTLTGYKNRVFDVRNRTPEDLLPVLKLLTSGFKGAQVSASNEFRTIIVRDFPENIAAIEDALKRLDTPEDARPDIELRIHVLLASNTEIGLSPFPADMKDVIGQLQTTLNYKNYYLLTTVVQRTRDSRGIRPGYVQGAGSAEIATPASSAAGGTDKRLYSYFFEANSLTLTPAASGAASVQLGNFNFSLTNSGGNVAKIHSDVSMREGEKVIVGTAGYIDKALILVMTAKVIK